MEIELRGISNFILKDINLKINDGEFFALLGPNGAGKTTLLNVISGLVPYSGNVLYDGIPVDDVPVERREISYLFQELYLFPNMTVYDNVAFGLKSREAKGKRAGVNIDKRVREVLKLLKIEQFKDRYPVHLSGGEKQRVALARALAVRPSILLLDEPFKSIDQTTSRYLREEVKDIQKKFGFTTIYVVHEISEIEEMSVRAAILIGGRIRLVGDSCDIYFNSKDEDVFKFVGRPNILDVDSQRKIDSGFVQLGWGKNKIVLPLSGFKNNYNIRKIVLFPWDVKVLPIDSSVLGQVAFNLFKGWIVRVSSESAIFRVWVRIGLSTIEAHVSRMLFERMGLGEGKEVWITFDVEKLKVY